MKTSPPPPSIVALGLATLASLSLTGSFISHAHDSVYHLDGSALSLFLPITLDLCLLWLSLAAVLALAERLPRFHTPIWSLLLLSIPYLLVRNWGALTNWHLPSHAVLAIVLVPALILLAAAPFWRHVAPAFALVQRFCATVLSVFALFGLAVLAQLLFFGWQARHLNETPILHHANTVAAGPASAIVPPRPRIIWIIFDELSFRQVYERRFPGLQLPAFDRLAATSTVFTQTIPVASTTSLVTASLLTGLPADSLRISSDGHLRAIHNPSAATWQPFDQHQTVFQDALNHGYSTAVAGWYIPYCRILPEVLDRCTWTSNLAYPGHMFARRSVAANTVSPFLSLIYAAARSSPGARHTPSPLAAAETQQHIADYRTLSTAGDALLTDSSANFVLLHLPIPHPGGIYDRRTQTFTTGASSYIDNLALADLYLAHVRQVLEQQNQWDSTTLLVMGDHSWRTSLVWRGTPIWTPEDDAASPSGAFDPRPAYILKLPHQQTPARIDTPFAATRTRALLNALLDNRLHIPADLEAWTEQPQRP